MTPSLNEMDTSLTNLVQRNLSKMISKPVEFNKNGFTKGTLTLYNPFVFDVSFRIYEHDGTSTYAITQKNGNIAGKKAVDIKIEHLMLDKVECMLDTLRIGLFFNILYTEFEMIFMVEALIVVHPPQSREVSCRSSLSQVQTYEKNVNQFQGAFNDMEQHSSLTNTNNKMISKLYITSKDIVFYKDEINSTTRILSIYNPLQWDIYVHIFIDSERFAAYPTKGIIRSGKVVHTKIEHFCPEKDLCDAQRITVELYIITKSDKIFLGVIEPSISVLPTNPTKIEQTNTETESDENTQPIAPRRFPGLSVMTMQGYHILFIKLTILFSLSLSTICSPLSTGFFYGIIRHIFYLSDLTVYYQHNMIIETLEYLSSLLSLLISYLPLPEFFGAHEIHLQSPQSNLTELNFPELSIPIINLPQFNFPEITFPEIYLPELYLFGFNLTQYLQDWNSFIHNMYYQGIGIFVLNILLTCVLYFN